MQGVSYGASERSFSRRLKLIQSLGLLLLCSAYIQGPIAKIADFPAAIAEMNHFGLSPAPLMAVGVILFELVASALVISGFLRGAAAGALAIFTLFATFIALRFWELPVGMERAMAMNGFFEHLGLVGAFLLVAWHDLLKKPACS